MMVLNANVSRPVMSSDSFPPMPETVMAKRVPPGRLTAQRMLLGKRWPKQWGFLDTATYVEAAITCLQDIGHDLKDTVQALPGRMCTLSVDYYRGLLLTAAGEDLKMPLPQGGWSFRPSSLVVSQRAKRRRKSGSAHVLMQIAIACHSGFGCCPESTWGTLPQLGSVPYHMGDNPVTVELAYSTSLRCPRPTAPYAVPGRNLIPTLRRNPHRIKEPEDLATFCMSLRTQGPYS